jgi:hypothetical protein
VELTVTVIQLSLFITIISVGPLINGLELHMTGMEQRLPTTYGMYAITSGTNIIRWA